MEKIAIPDEVKDLLDEISEENYDVVKLNEDAHLQVHLDDRFFEIEGADCAKLLGSIDNIYSLHETVIALCKVEVPTIKLHAIELDSDLTQTLEDLFNVRKER